MFRNAIRYRLVLKYFGFLSRGRLRRRPACKAQGFGPGSPQKGRSLAVPTILTLPCDLRGRHPLFRDLQPRKRHGSGRALDQDRPGAKSKL